MSLSKTVTTGLMISFLLGVALVNNSWAKSNDHNQKLTVKADTIHYDDSNKRSRLEGNVAFSQGSTYLKGKKAYVYFDRQDTVKRLITYGNPARYSTIEEPDKGRLHAKADKIDYKPPKNLVTLTGHARIQQNGNIITGHKIYYNMESKTLRSSAKANSRTEVHIQPPESDSHD